MIVLIGGCAEYRGFDPVCPITVAFDLVHVVCCLHATATRTTARILESGPTPRAPQFGGPRPQQYGGPQAPQYGGPQYGAPGYGMQQYYPPPRKRKVWLIVLLVIGIPVLLMVGCVAMAVGFNAMADEKPATTADKQLVLKAEDLEPYLDGYHATPSKATATRIEQIDDSWEIDYEYEDDTIYLMSVYTHENSAEDAKYTYSGQQVGTSFGYAQSGADIKEVERNDLYKWGDESKFYLIQKNGQNLGNRLVARKGGKVVYIIFSGVYFDDPHWIHELLDPLMKRIETSG